MTNTPHNLDAKKKICRVCGHEYAPKLGRRKRVDRDEVMKLVRMGMTIHGVARAMNCHIQHVRRVIRERRMGMK